MPRCELASKPLFQGIRQVVRKPLAVSQRRCTRPLGTSRAAQDEAQPEVPPQPFYRAPDPVLVTSPRLERRLIRAGTPPVGSRRRRAALQNSPNIPFQQLPYQCFQEARKFLLEDREEKLKQIEAERGRIARLRATDAAEIGGEVLKQRRLRSMEGHLERLKIYADINDPVVKKRFEDGNGMGFSLMVFFFSACILIRLIVDM